MTGKWRRGWEVDVGEFDRSLHWLPTLTATPTPIPTPFSTSVHGGSAASSRSCATVLLSSSKMRGPIGASRHTLVRKISRANLCLEAHAQSCAGQPVPRGTRWSSNFAGQSVPRGTRLKISRANACLEAHARFWHGKLSRERFLVCALVHSAKTRGWPGWSGWY